MFLERPVAEVMEKNIRTVHCQSTVAEVESLLLRYNISGAPVVTTDGELMGVVSKADIAPFHRDPREPSSQTELAYSITTPVAITVDGDSTIKEAARLMVQREIHRLIVVQGGIPIGILTALDIARIVAES